MENNNLLMIILAFVVGFMLQGMTKNMCGGQLVEGYFLGLGGDKSCRVNEAKLKDGANRCRKNSDCRGQRVCENYERQVGYCSGEANC